MLYEVHKFSKFIHGCATLLPEDVQSVPYWIDDASIRESVVASGAGHILTLEEEKDEGEGVVGGEFGNRRGAGPGANQIYPHLLPHGTSRDKAKGIAIEARTSGQRISGDPGLKVGAAYANAGMTYADHTDEDDYDASVPGGCWPSGCCVGAPETAAPTSIQKVEPKIFFANEVRVLFPFERDTKRVRTGRGGLRGRSELLAPPLSYSLHAIPPTIFFSLSLSNPRF